MIALNVKTLARCGGGLISTSEESGGAPEPRLSSSGSLSIVMTSCASGVWFVVGFWFARIRLARDGRVEIWSKSAKSTL